MAGILSYVPGRLAGSAQAKLVSIDIPGVQVHQIESSLDRRARCLKHLIKANHVNHALVNINNGAVNRSAHLLCTAYLVGASEAQLHALYEEAIKSLEPWTPSPAEIVDLDWLDFLGDRRYQRAYVDFFEDKLAMTFSYDWKQEVGHFLFSSEKPLVCKLMGGLGQPLVHLAHAYEMDCKEVGMEALGMACVEHDFLCKYFEDASYTKPSPLASDSLLDLVTKLCEDQRFKELPKGTGARQLEAVLEKHEDVILDYWNAWELAEPSKQFCQSQHAAVLLAVATLDPDAHTYDLLHAHLLTVSHAVRTLLSSFPPQHHITLVRAWWLLAIIVLVTKGRPWSTSPIPDIDLDGKDWKYVDRQALASKWSKDAQYIQAIRAMEEASRTWGDAQKEYIRAAVAFVDNFEGWRD